MAEVRRTPVGRCNKKVEIFPHWDSSAADLSGRSAGSYTSQRSTARVPYDRRLKVGWIRLVPSTLGRLDSIPEQRVVELVLGPVSAFLRRGLMPRLAPEWNSLAERATDSLTVCWQDAVLVGESASLPQRLHSLPVHSGCPEVTPRGSIR